MWGWERTNHRESEAVQTYLVILSRFSTEAKGNIRVHTFGYVQMEVHILMQYVSALFFSNKSWMFVNSFQDRDKFHLEEIF